MAQLLTHLSLSKKKSISNEALHLIEDSSYQAEVIFNRLLPYADQLNEEADKLLADIKANYGRCVMLRDINPGCIYWSEMLKKYIRLYGLRFTKEEHIALVKLSYQLVTIPELQSVLLTTFGKLLISLLRDKRVLSTDDLQLPWEPLFKQCYTIITRKAKSYTLYIYPASVENLLESVVLATKIYFPPNTTQEVLDELRPYIYPTNTYLTTRTFKLLRWFLPIQLPPEHHSIGHQLWLDEFMKLWEVYHNDHNWECTLMMIIAELAWNNIGYIDWNPYIPLMFTRIFRSLNLPVTYQNVDRNNVHNLTDKISDAKWIASVLGDNTKAQDYLDKFLNSIETYLHPVNHGTWTSTLEILIVELVYHVVIRVNKERYGNVKPLEGYQLTDANIDTFVNTVLPVIITSVCSDSCSQNFCDSLQYLANIRANLVIPRVLERLYPTIGTSIAPHKMITAMHCMMSIAKPLTQGLRCMNKDYAFAEGPMYVLPLLFSSLSGIDPNDQAKCSAVLALISTYITLVPVVNLSTLMIKPNNDDDHFVCEQTSQFEDFVLQLMDRIFMMIETSKIEFVRPENTSSTHLENDHEEMFQYYITKCFTVVISQASEPIFMSALNKFCSYVMNNDLEIKVAGQSASVICNIFSHFNGKLTLRSLFFQLADRILNSLSDDATLEEEHLDNQLMFSMLLMQNLMITQGDALMPYIDKIIQILDTVTKLKSLEGHKTACIMLKCVLFSLCNSQTVKIDENLNEPGYPYWQNWGMEIDVKTAKLVWYTPTNEEYIAAEKIFNRYFIPAVNSIKNLVDNKTYSMSRHELQRDLKLISYLLDGCDAVLPIWSETPIVSKTFESCVYTFKPFVENKFEIKMPDGSNVRKFIVQTLTQLQDLLLRSGEDDIKSLLNLAELWHCVSLSRPKDASTEEYENFELRKIIFQDYLTGSSGFSPYVLFQRMILQHDLRYQQTTYTFTETTRTILMNLFRLSTSRYSEVRASAQIYLGYILNDYPNAYEVMIPWIMEVLKKDTEVHHDAYKGVLYLLTTYQKKILINSNDWNVLSNILPAVVLAKPSMKESITLEQNLIIKKTYSGFLLTNIKLDIPDNYIAPASELWIYGLPPSFKKPSDSEIQKGLDRLEQLNNINLELYHVTFNKLMEAISNKSIHWRHRQMARTFISFLIHPYHSLPTSVVRYFVNALNHELLDEREMSWFMMVQILKLQKRKQKKVTLEITNHEKTIKPGPRSDNAWLQYNYEKRPLTAEQWDEPCYIHNIYTGYYTWPKKLEVYAPSAEQPTLERTRELNEQEQEINHFFSDQENIAKLIEYLTLEENKGQEQFHAIRYLMFKNLFRNHGDAYLTNFLKHLTDMVQSNVDCVQRAAAEILSGIIRGSKHWTFDMTQNMWKKLLPIIKQVLNNLTEETINNWFTCFHYGSCERDPRKLHWLLEFIIEECQNVRTESSFSEHSRLMMLRAVITNQAWRLIEMCQRLLPKFKDRLLENPFANVRDQLMLGMITVFNIRSKFEGDEKSVYPQLVDFVNKIQPRLKSLLTIEDKNLPKYIELKKLLDMTCRWMIQSINTSHFGTLSSFYQLYPIICQMENEDKETDISSICQTCSAALAQTFVLPRHIPAVLQTIDEVSKSSSWSTRACSIQFLQVLIFHNMSLFLSKEEWIETVTNIVLRLLKDENIEVRSSSAQVLNGLLHCTLVKDCQALLEEFKQLAKTKLNTKKCKVACIETNNAIRLRHAGILGMCAFIQAHPYDVPKDIPLIFEHLSAHLNDPEPIPTTIRKTINDFKRTHCDSWTGLQGLTKYFTQEQLYLLQDSSLPALHYA